MRPTFDDESVTKKRKTPEPATPDSNMMVAEVQEEKEEEVQEKRRKVETATAEGEEENRSTMRTRLPPVDARVETLFEAQFAVLSSDGCDWLLGAQMARSLNRETYNLYKSISRRTLMLRRGTAEEIDFLGKRGLIGPGIRSVTLIPYTDAVKFMTAEKAKMMRRKRRQSSLKATVVVVANSKANGVDGGGGEGGEWDDESADDSGIETLLIAARSDDEEEQAAALAAQAQQAQAGEELQQERNNNNNNTNTDNADAVSDLLSAMMLMINRLPRNILNRDQYLDDVTFSHFTLGSNPAHVTAAAALATSL
jgi:hypothetical protein